METNSESSHLADGGSRNIERVAIIGAGWTGRQIAGQMVTHGVRVILCDESSGALNTSRAWILSNLNAFESQGYWPATSQEQVDERLELVHPDFLFGGDQAATVAEGVRGVGLVLECIPEQVALKRRVLKRASEVFGETTIVASNSSYFVPSTFSKHVRHPERYAHFHFHVPIWKATVVDVAAGPQTSEETLGRLSLLAHKIGQTPIVQRRENSGYVFNAMLKSVLKSALELLDRDVATAEDIDLAWRKATGMPIGPFGIMDQIGLDILLQTMSNGRFVDGDDVWSPLIAKLQPYIDAGHLGVKTGKGFYDYPVDKD
jgi:3-hydroxybutyryl-CoA dehydrogenase